MFIKLLFIFTLVPVIELYVLIEAGRQLGVGPTIAMIFITGIAGAYLARSQGFSLIGRIQKDLNEGRVPASEMMDGAMILAGGLLLLTPGFCTDLIGFCLLTPATRAIFKGWLQKWLERKIARGEIHFRRF
ncbi:FxsA family protein [Malonomonas rubra]|uniref:FxsA family protein n=1 Tax=Malonomonas rubra TaxID=57040 RepID=UPI0026F1414D|nr:FxsA family protein [Malonomonas rubra]